jgi:hypothetical protein
MMRLLTFLALLLASASAFQASTPFRPVPKVCIQKLLSLEKRGTD